MRDAVAGRSSRTEDLSDQWICRVAKGGGVLGVILCDHFLSEGQKGTTTLDASVKVIASPIDHIHDYPLYQSSDQARPFVKGVEIREPDRGVEGATNRLGGTAPVEVA